MNTTLPGWVPMLDGSTLGDTGSEGGVIIRDDEHPWGARITLERDASSAPFTITCGVYGWMVHTRFFSAAAEAETAYVEMRDALVAILAPPADPAQPDRSVAATTHAIHRFLERFP